MRRSNDGTQRAWLQLKAVMALATIALALAGCGQRPVYSHFEPTHSSGWDRGDTLHFTIPVADSTRCRTIRLDVRTTSAFPYTQLTLLVRQHARATGKRRQDSLTIDIADRKGNPIGSGTAVRTHTTTLPIAAMAPNDTIDISVSHAMNRREMPGISDVGITVED